MVRCWLASVSIAFSSEEDNLDVTHKRWNSFRDTSRVLIERRCFSGGKASFYPANEVEHVNNPFVN